MTEKLRVTTPETAVDAIERPGFLGSIALMRHKVGMYTPGQRLDKALEEIRATRPSHGDIAEGIEAELDHAAAEHAEHDAGGLDFEWDEEWPDKSVGYIDPDDPTSVYREREN